MEFVEFKRTCGRCTNPPQIGTLCIECYREKERHKHHMRRVKKRLLRKCRICKIQPPYSYHAKVCSKQCLRVSIVQGRKRYKQRKRLELLAIAHALGLPNPEDGLGSNQLEPDEAWDSDDENQLDARWKQIGFRV